MLASREVEALVEGGVRCAEWMMNGDEGAGADCDMFCE